ncbi:MAG TPA: NAD-dependent epimerase/dehydratase family protein [Thermoleophilaceae bacterium]|nr:NAD-dependent epimerase/dehydratase family protein [Thermoleophilaceae bacterium]
MRRRPILITGGAGFVGTNLADRLLREGRAVRVLDDLSRPGVERNLAWLEREHPGLLEVELGDLGDAAHVVRAMRNIDSVFHLAAQVAVTTSLDDPMRDAAVNLQGTLNLLEAARQNAVALIFTSTNKVYGALAGVEVREGAQRWEPGASALRRRGVAESWPLSFCTPYGCSKGAADQYVLDYAASFGVPTAVFRMSCIYGPHQHGNEDQGWVAHFLIRALDREPIRIYGDGKQVRDVLFVDDLVDALLIARRRIHRLSGNAFNIGGGPGNAVSLVEVIAMITALLGEQPQLSLGPWRTGDQRWYVSDTGRFSAATGWAPRIAPEQGLSLLHEWVATERRAREPTAA